MQKVIKGTSCNIFGSEKNRLGKLQKKLNLVSGLAKNTKYVYTCTGLQHNNCIFMRKVYSI